MTSASFQPGDTKTLKLLGLLIGSLITFMVVLIVLCIVIQKAQPTTEDLKAQLVFGESLVAQNMDVEVKHRLPGIRPVVDNGAERIADA